MSNSDDIVLLQAFNDCEELIGRAIEVQVASLLDSPAIAFVVESVRRNVYSASEDERIIAKLALTLRSIPLAIRAGEYRTDKYTDPASSTNLTTIAAKQLGRKGGKARSTAQIEASRINGKQGGRPRNQREKP